MSNGMVKRRGYSLSQKMNVIDYAKSIKDELSGASMTGRDVERRIKEVCGIDAAYQTIKNWLDEGGIRVKLKYTDRFINNLQGTSKIRPIDRVFATSIKRLLMEWDLSVPSEILKLTDDNV